LSFFVVCSSGVIRSRFALRRDICIGVNGVSDNGIPQVFNKHLLLLNFDCRFV